MYIKQYDSNGLVTNPITKEQPFLHVGQNRSQRRMRQRKSNNRAGHGMVVFGNMRYRIVKQHTPVYKTVATTTVMGTTYRKVKVLSTVIVHSILR